jgi:hypothetical protein
MAITPAAESAAAVPVGDTPAAALDGASASDGSMPGVSIDIHMGTAMSCRVEDIVVGGMDVVTPADGRPRGVVLAIDIAGAVSRAATRVRKTKRLLEEAMRCCRRREQNRLVCSDRREQNRLVCRRREEKRTEPSLGIT